MSDYLDRLLEENRALKDEVDGMHQTASYLSGEVTKARTEVERLKGVLARAHIVIGSMVDHANTSGQAMLNELADEAER